MMGCKVFRRYSEILDGGVQFPVFFLKGSVVLNVVSDDFLNLFQAAAGRKLLMFKTLHSPWRKSRRYSHMMSTRCRRSVVIFTSFWY